MLSESKKFIYLHAPRTGGNSLQSILLPYSNDRMVVLPYQDGKDRFEIRGEFTPTKHTKLAEYREQLGNRMNEYKIVISIREPADRAVSAYFAPARWMKKRDNGSSFIRDAEWDASQFVSYLQSGSLLPMVSFLRIGAEVIEPHYVVRHEHYAEDVRRVAASFGLSIGQIPHLNRSDAAKRWRYVALADRAIRREIESIFATDYSFFGYKRVTD